MSRHLCLLVLIGSVLLGTGCRKPPPPKEHPHGPRDLFSFEGKSVTVKFRRDAVGAGGDAPVGLGSDVFNNAKLSLRGVLQKVFPDGIVLQHYETFPSGEQVRVEEHQAWIPWSVILMVDTVVEPKTTSSSPPKPRQGNDHHDGH